MKSVRATRADLARRLRIRATDAQRRGATACETSPRPPCRGDTSAGGEKHSVIFKGNGGTDGPSRPRQCPRPAGWRGTGLDANIGPARRRSFSCSTRRDAFGVARLEMSAARPAWQCFKQTLHRSKKGNRSSPAAPQALRIVHHEKERRHRDPWFASSPPNSVSAGRGHRRGLDGPSMPKPS